MSATQVAVRLFGVEAILRSDRSPALENKCPKCGCLVLRVDGHVFLVSWGCLWRVSCNLCGWDEHQRGPQPEPWLPATGLVVNKASRSTMAS
jgi:hypothetical protein